MAKELRGAGVPRAQWAVCGEARGEVARVGPRGVALPKDEGLSLLALAWGQDGTLV